MPSGLRRRTIAALAAGAALAMGLAGCSTTEPDSGAAAEAVEVSTVRLGFFPNVTHAPALVGLQEGLFKSALKTAGVTVTPTAFNAGPDAVTALFGGSLDIAYIGPNPTINAYVQSGGDGVRVISGAASGGAALVVRPGIAGAEDLRGKAVATPQLGNTQDVALRYWLKQQGLSTNAEGGGDVSIKPQANAEGLAAYAAGQIDGAWVPEPWVSEYLRAGAEVLVDEADLWPNGEFVTTNVVVRTEFLDEHPDLVADVLKGHLDALESIKRDPAGSARAVGEALRALTGSAPDPVVLKRALRNVAFTADPLPGTLIESADHAVAVGLLDQAGLDDAGGLTGIYSLAPLNGVLADRGQPKVAQP